ncbi:MAG: class A beta-lactamase-related serine hydrolase [[Clostridium] fimetarium]|nr:class A beta-lactamase-related serine hydrolase [Alistipes timonensis]MCM1404821.1 class A beta-lactamase-related serine hydrolase [[Clostridium] fimetarium]
MKNIVVMLLAAIMMVACSDADRYGAMRKQLEDFISDKDAEIGVAVIIDGADTVEVNGRGQFPMLSVYKFPIALAFDDGAQAGAEMLLDTITLTRDDLLPDTNSPMRDRYASCDTVRLPLNEVLAYSLQLSDNNASDVIVRLAGGMDRVRAALCRLDAAGVSVESTEAEMHADNALCYRNSASPLAMARLMDRFAAEIPESGITREIKRLMETCATGTDRLAKPLAGTGAVLGHKTGTGFTLPDGRLMAVNDAGYVLLPDGRRYTIAVFVANSGYSMAATEALIADISAIVYNAVK